MSSFYSMAIEIPFPNMKEILQAVHCMWTADYFQPTFSAFFFGNGVIFTDPVEIYSFC